MRRPLLTYVYVDGFNLYFGLGAHKNPYRWLDVSKLCELLLPRSEIRRVKYFTSEVEVRPVDPDKLERQRRFVRALRTTPNLDVYYGKFLSRKRWLKRVRADGNERVWFTSEKASDVNLGAHLVMDGFRHRYEVAVVVSDDTDLLTPIQIVRERLGLTVGLINPQRHKPHDDLLANTDFVLQIRRGALSASQFPNTLTDAEGTFQKPDEWG